MQLWQLPRIVACRRPSCRAPRGFSCRTTGGYDAPFHMERQTDVAGLTEAEARAALAELVDETQARIRAQIEAAQRRAADPAVQAQLAAQRAHWDAVEAEVNARLRAHEREMRERCRDPWIHGVDCHCRTPGWTRPPPPPDRRGQAPVADLNAERARRRPHRRP